MSSPHPRSPLLAKIRGLSVPPSLFLALAILGLSVLTRRYLPFLSDDALITLRYSRRFAQGEGLTWTEGERVEGYTDFLWVVLNAVPIRLGLDAISSARMLGYVGATSALLWVGLRSDTLELDWRRLLSGSLFLATLIPLAVWAIGGLEHGFMAGVLALALLFLDDATQRDGGTFRRWLARGLPLAALTLLRADGAVLVAGALGGLWLARGANAAALGRAGTLCLAPLAAWTAQLGFRWLYYGQLVPNTAKAKVSFSLARLELGLTHVRQGLTPLLVAGALVVLACVFTDRTRRRRLLVPLGTSLVWLLYLASVGGDIFPGWRQLLLGVVPWAFVLAVAGESIAERIAERPTARRILLGAAAPLLFVHLHLQLRDPENTRARTERWEWEGRWLGPTLREAFGAQQPLLAVDAAGALPFWTHFPALDLLGLNDAYLTEHPPPWFGTQGIGHELGDPEYFLRRAPDLFVFCNAAGAEHPCFTATKQLVRMPAFTRDHRLVFVRNSRDHRLGTLHVRLAGRIGGNLSEDRVELPGYFLASTPEVPALANERGDLIVPLIPERPGVLRRVPLTPGTWRVEWFPPVPLTLGFRCGAHDASDAGLGPTVKIGSRLPDLLLGPPPGGAPSVVERLVFTRTTETPSFRCPTRGSSDSSNPRQQSPQPSPPATPAPAAR